MPATVPVRRAALRAVPFALVLGLAAVPVFAQDDADAGHPVHIHAGTCAELGDVVFPLDNLVAPDMAATPGADAGAAATPEADMGEVVAESTTTVEAPLADILAAPHAINVHESAENIQNYIACGDLSGEPEDGRLEIDLAELNDSGLSGMATLEEDGDGATTVSVMVMRADAATPAAGAAAAQDALAVDIKDFLYVPDPITVPVGGSVTWTNSDPVPHTATARDREVLQSGTLRQGESFSQIFDTAGSYEYFCEFHSGMKGTVVVE
jgi:plastocyanin